MSEDVFSRNQSFRQAIATTIACRTIIKYNSNLSEEQKAEILGEIESTLGFLENRLGPALENDLTLIPEKPLAPSIGAADEERAPASGQDDRYISLQNLYRLHQSYLSNKPGRGIAALEARYRTVMEVLDQVQELAGQQVASNTSEVERMLGRVRGFVTALYCMFREFALLLSNIVDGKTIDMDTEALALLPKHSLALLQEQRMRDITPLIEVYGRHLRLQERKGALTACAREAGALLVFLEENLSQTFARRKEITAQIKTIAGLLSELTDLLTDYGQAVASIIQSPSASL